MLGRVLRLRPAAAAARPPTIAARPGRSALCGCASSTPALRSPSPALHQSVRRGAASDAAGQAAAHEREAAGDADEGVPLGELLRPNPVSTLEQFDARSRCVVARHPQRVRPWQERSEAVQTMLEARDEATPPMFMVVIIKGKQYKLTLDDVVAAEKLEADINEYLRVDSVLLVGSKEWTVVGTPHVPTASLVLQVEEHMKTQKVHVFKKKRVRLSRHFLLPFELSSCLLTILLSLLSLSVLAP